MSGDLHFQRTLSNQQTKNQAKLCHRKSTNLYPIGIIKNAAMMYLVLKLTSPFTKKQAALLPAFPLTSTIKFNTSVCVQGTPNTLD